jgi:hypothetical protein
LLLLAAAVTGAAQPTPAPKHLPAILDEDIPGLVKHLPNWESVQKQAKYVVTLEDLKSALPNQLVFDAVSFEGGTEAVTAAYGQSQLAIVEFSTPQFSVDNDQRIAAKIQELKSQSQPRRLLSTRR